MELGGAELDKLRELLKGEEGVVVAYLFGSRARGLRTRYSDIDVAILLSKTPHSLLDYYLSMVNKISGAVGCEADLVILNNAPPLLKYQVIKYGKPIYVKSERERILFEARSICEYLDFRRAMERYDECLVRQVLG